jgi:CheY-like chemotaxis protein
VLLVDTNDHLVAVVSEWLSSEPGVRIAVRPDLVLIDARLPDTSGFAATKQIKSLPDAPVVVLMTLHDSKAVREEASSAGADALIAGAAIASQLRPLVRSLLELAESGSSVRDSASGRLPSQPSAEPPAET